MAQEDYFKVRVSGDVRIALPLSHVQTVLKIEPQLVCPIPGLDVSLLGAVNREGQLIWVMDLSHVLGLGFVYCSPGQRLAAVVLSSANNSSGHQGSLACVVSALEGVFTPLHVQKIDKRLKPRLRDLLQRVAYHDRLGIAILEPDHLFDLVQDRQLQAATAIADTVQR
ncbi:MAG: chemotaxis protein CheW [Oscillatoriales cyanobacterium]|nr:MAG: chemotaxis protein CheW [Oscillatoriales cyanobacterium]